MPRIRFRIRLWMVMALVAIAAIALALPGSRRWMQRQWERRRDSEVLKVVMGDLLDPKNPEYVHFIRNRGVASEIVVNDLTVSREWIAFTFPDGSTGHSEDRADRLLRPDLYSDLIRRNGVPVKVSDFGWSDSRIVSADLARELEDTKGNSWPIAFWKRHPKAWGHVAISLPGYSAGGDEAIVVANSGPSEHGEWWIFRLKKSGGRWRIDNRTLDAGK